MTAGSPIATALDPVRTAVERLKRPEYTGENRCVPCTAANVVIAAGLGLAVGWVWLPAGAFVLAVGLAAIYLRGYLVPGTPTLTKRYFPEWVLRRFDKAPAEELPDTADPEALEELLVTAGALEPCEDGTDLCLTPAFERAWNDRIEAHRDDAGAAFEDVLEVPALLDVEPDRLEVDRHGEALVASVDDVRIAQWESRAAYLADVAAAAELKARYPAWDRLGFQARTQVLGGLRLWLDSCPACDGPVAFGQDTVESCCRSIDVLAATCQACDARLFEAEYAEAPDLAG